MSHIWLSKKFPIYRDAHLLNIMIEEMVKKFSRYHKYTIGTDLRQQSASIHLAVANAINLAEERPAWVRQVVLKTQSLKLTIQRAKDCHSFANFKDFELLAKKAVAVSAQARRWHNKMQRHGQN